ncbi:family 20 glycosylhydrolase [Pseudoalteromonas fenneropenaei]|uniref:beta-N-acetylhexosaminidase n=1 Tax=Pseudoalteromonas fenneropenaei TaxID=1737459 RepID=A0ABV7CKB4_9GAMM
MTIKRTLLAALVLSSPLLAEAKFAQAQLDAFAKATQLTFAVEDNFYGEAGQFLGSMTLKNYSQVALPKGKGDWQLYIHSVRKLNEVKFTGLTLEHINGDLHRLTPNKDFPGLAVGAEIKVPFVGSAWVVAYSDFMPRAFITVDKLQPAIFANTDTEELSQFVAPFVKEQQLKRYNTPQDHTQTATAELRFVQNLQLNAVAESAALKRIIPKPQSVDYKRGEALLDSSWELRFAGQLKSEVGVFLDDLKTYGIELKAEADHISPTKGAKVLSLSVKPDFKDTEAYRLVIDSNRISIEAADNAGAFYGLQSLLALFPASAAGSVTLPQLKIADAPRFLWRGMHYDNGRNYHGKAAMFKLVEQMARYKLNKFHWHFSEDEGWRLEIPDLPELTEIGANRCFDLTERECLLTQLGTGPFKSGSGNGYLTRAEFVELLKFAKARHVQIIPEIEGPGHARAAIKAMEARYHKLLAAGKKDQAEQYLLSDLNDQSQYSSVQAYTDNSVNVCMESSYRFIEKVTYELQAMYREAGVQLTNLHFGGDEVGVGSWQQSPACQALFAEGKPGVIGVQDLKPYFTKRVSEIFARRGIAPGAWEDGLMYDTTNPFKRDEFANKTFTANVWDNIWEWGVADRAYRLANDGYQVILSHGTHLYFDHPYEAHPEERGYYWAARYTDARKVFSYMPDHVYANADFTRNLEPIANLEALVGRPLPQLEKPENILGIQGQVWSETIRTEEQLLAMVFPRLLPLAERAWYQASWEGNSRNEKAFNEDWSEFAATLSAKELAKLSRAGIKLHLPVPGGVIEEGKLLANSAFPHLTIQFSVDNGQSWQNYASPTSVEKGQVILLRTYLDEQNVSRVTKLGE